jgi:hypothetical protein
MRRKSEYGLWAAAIHANAIPVEDVQNKTLPEREVLHLNLATNKGEKALSLIMTEVFNSIFNTKYSRSDLRIMWYNSQGGPGLGDSGVENGKKRVERQESGIETLEG